MAIYLYAAFEKMGNHIYLPLHLDRFNWTYSKDDPNICALLLLLLVFMWELAVVHDSDNSTWQFLWRRGRSVLQGRPACLGLGGVCHLCGIQGTYRHTTTINILWYVHLMWANQSNMDLCWGYLHADALSATQRLFVTFQVSNIYS